MLWDVCYHPTLCLSLGLGSPWEWRVDLLWTICISRHQVIFWLWKHSGKDCHEAVYLKHQAGKVGFPLCQKPRIKTPAVIVPLWDRPSLVLYPCWYLWNLSVRKSQHTMSRKTACLLGFVCAEEGAGCARGGWQWMQWVPGSSHAEDNVLLQEEKVLAKN